MLYQLSHIIKDKLPFVWNLIEWLNARLFLLRYGRRLRGVPGCLAKYQGAYQIREATLGDVQPLVAFFAKQPVESFQYFQPHGFDEKSLKKLINRKSQIMILVKKENRIVGYMFMRCFFNGKCFRGKMVDYRWRGKGIAILLGELSTEIATLLRLRLFGTISKDNVSSMRSSQASNEIKVIEELPNDYLYIEYLPKQEY